MATTAEQRRRISEYSRQGFSIRQIADLVGCTRGAASHWRDGHAPVPRERSDHELIHTLVGEGKTTAQIASIVGCSTRTVQRVRAEHGLSVATNEWISHPITPERLEAIASYVAERAPTAFIMRQLHVNGATLRRYFPEASWTLEERREASSMLQQLRKLPNTLDGIRAHHQVQFGRAA